MAARADELTAYLRDPPVPDVPLGLDLAGPDPLTTVGACSVLNAAGGLWSFKLNGWCVPGEGALRSEDPDHRWDNGVQGGSRIVYVARYREDMDREELSEEIQ